jgi:hypothetical protein
MKKPFSHLFLIMLVAVLLFSFSNADEKPWFDMEHCSFCKILTEYDGLLDNMTWEHYPISNGVVTISTVNDAYREAYDEVGTRMQAVGQKVMQGEELPLCQMCATFGTFFSRGAKYEKVATKKGDFSLMTSDDPELVKEMHEWARHTNEEMAKFTASKNKK